MEFILSKIDELTEKYDTNCPFKLAKQLGIHIVYENLGSTLGYFNKFCRIKMIHINETASDSLKKFICAHELGHALFHPNANTPFLKKNTFFSTETIELEANYFATHLLFSTSANYTTQEIDDNYLFKIQFGTDIVTSIPKMLVQMEREGELGWLHFGN